jgi:thiamine pyrophosphokinase
MQGQPIVLDPAAALTLSCEPERPIVIVRGGPAPDPRVRGHVAPDSFVIAVDSGYEHAVALGLVVDVVVGDLDSISPSALLQLQALGIPIVRYPTDKDATDLELALELALTLSAEVASRPVTVLGGAGWDDRFDHVAGQIGLLASPRWKLLTLTAYLGTASVRPVHGGSDVALSGVVGSVVSIVPVGGPAHGVGTDGLRYPLHGETLDVFATRGVSNEFAASSARVSLTHGVVLVIVPSALVSTEVPPHAREGAIP